MAAAPVKKPTINTVTAIFFVGIAVFFDAIKIILLFVDAIPFVGAPIGILGSWLISALEFIFITVGLYIAGAYRGDSGTTNALLTMGLGMVDMVPIVDDFPFTTGTVILVIAKSRFNDKMEAEKNAKKLEAQQKSEQEQQLRQQRAEEVAQRVRRN